MMPIEIERKFLVKNSSFIKDAFKVSFIKQGFLNSHKNRVVRVRTIGDKGFITIKGLTTNFGTTRKEWEYEIDIQDAEDLLLICESTIIEKTRYFVKQDSFIFEIDVFKKENKGLILAEIELISENQKFKKPKWLGKEVTGNKKYFNAYISLYPYNSWS